MKRRALLIGNTDGLPGVKVDISAVQNFLKSARGGRWKADEITTLIDPKEIDLGHAIREVKGQKNDFVFVHYSGHGGQERQTFLEINSNGERIKESDLFGLSERQVCIFDCCRTYSEISAKAALNESLESFALDSHSDIREKYDLRQMQAIPQQVQMYACSKGQSALDTKEGGIYTSQILKSALHRNNNDQYITLGQIHQLASQKVEALAKSKGSKQEPEIIVPRCLSCQQLIFAINL